MSVVIIGGNECMERSYRELCRKHGCRTKVFCKYKTGMGDRIGEADLMILFTNTVSHKMVQSALSSVKPQTQIVRTHTSSMASLKKILSDYA